MSERGNEKSALVGDGYDHFVKVRVTGSALAPISRT